MVIQSMKAQPRLIVCSLAGGALALLLPAGWRLPTRLLVAWDSATAFYLLLVLAMMARSDIGRIRRRAALQDEGRWVVLILTTVAAIASLAAIVAELAAAKALRGHGEWQHIALAGLTVFLSWSFLHMMFTLHYAHEYYSPEEGGVAEGLEFPGHAPPDYWDFAYYSFVIGTACATADVNILSASMRRITALHCILAFFFNTTILALMVNIGAGLF